MQPRKTKHWAAALGIWRTSLTLIDMGHMGWAVFMTTYSRHAKRTGLLYSLVIGMQCKVIAALIAHVKELFKLL